MKMIATFFRQGLFVRGPDRPMTLMIDNSRGAKSPRDTLSREEITALFARELGKPQF